jgi:hypothetical protein
VMDASSTDHTAAAWDCNRTPRGNVKLGIVSLAIRPPSLSVAHIGAALISLRLGGSSVSTRSSERFCSACCGSDTALCVLGSTRERRSAWRGPGVEETRGLFGRLVRMED